MYYYYILQDPSKLTESKVGVTKNPDQRIKAYRTAAPQCYYYRIYKDVNRRHEKKILDILRDVFYVDREVVRCGANMVSNIVDAYFSDLGIDRLSTNKSGSIVTMMSS